MADIILTKALRQEYAELFDTCEIRAAAMPNVDKAVAELAANKARYQAVGAPLGIPWFFIAVTHSMESTRNFQKHLHNGDPLTARTVRVPAGRPKTGNPPFTWEFSAADALTRRKIHEVKDWTVAGLLYQLEGYNGFGYRRFHSEVLTPYLWSQSNHYVKGKYVEDGKFDPEAVSKQIGAAVFLRRMAEKGIVRFDAVGDPLSDHEDGDREPEPDLGPMVTFSTTVRSEAARTLQRALNRFPGIFLEVDGIPGKDTSDAFQKVTGHFLKGDPRA